MSHRNLQEILAIVKLNLNHLNSKEKQILIEEHVSPTMKEFVEHKKYPAKHSITKKDYGISSDNIISLLEKNSWDEVIEHYGIISRNQAKRPVRVKRRDHTYDWSMIGSWRENEGLSYTQIIKRHMEQFGYAPVKATISHHFSPTTAKLSKARQVRAKRSLRNKISRKLDGFRFKYKPEPYVHYNKQTFLKEIIRIKLKLYRRKNLKTTRHSTDRVLTEDAIPYLVSTQALDLNNWTCVSPLTGDTLDLTEEFHLDHWDNEGGNTLDNLAILSRAENMIKGTLSISELVTICEKIVKKHKK